LFENIAAGAQLDISIKPINSCITAADECVTSICGFMKSIEMPRRGFAWYATAWLITASFVQATCLIYSPNHPLSAGWKVSLFQAVECLQILGSSLDVALRAKDIIQNVLGKHRSTHTSCDHTITKSLNMQRIGASRVLLPLGA
jgi:hypothetical protein